MTHAASKERGPAGWRRCLAPAGLFLLALLIRLAYVWIWRFDGLYGQDAYAYFDQAAALRDGLLAGRLPPRDFFWPNGYPLLAALFMLALGKTALAAQLPCLLAGAGLAPLLHGLALELFDDRRAGLLAGLLAAASSQPIASSVVAMADMPALFWAALAAWLLARWARGDRRASWLLAAGAALGLAIVSRWLYAALVPAFAGCALWRLRQLRRPLWWLALPALGALLLIGPQILLSLGRPEGLAHSWLLGWSPLNALRRSFQTIDGAAAYRLPNWLFYGQPLLHPSYLMPPLGLAALWAVRRRWRSERWALALLLGWSLPAYLFLAGIPYQNFRFSLTLYPPLALLGAAGIINMIDIIKSNKLRTAMIGCVAALLAGALAWSTRPVGAFLAAQGRDKSAARQAAALVPPGSPLLSFGLTLTLRHYAPLDVRELFYLPPQALAPLLACGDAYVLIDSANIERQWRGSQLEASYRWLRDEARLAKVADFPPYALFAASRPEPSQCASP